MSVRRPMTSSRKAWNDNFTSSVKRSSFRCATGGYTAVCKPRFIFHFLPAFAVRFTMFQIWFSVKPVFSNKTMGGLLD
jgi:hypothetical protein